MLAISQLLSYYFPEGAVGTRTNTRKNLHADDGGDGDLINRNDFDERRRRLHKEPSRLIFGSFETPSESREIYFVRKSGTQSDIISDEFSLRL